MLQIYSISQNRLDVLKIRFSFFFKTDFLAKTKFFFITFFFVSQTLCAQTAAVNVIVSDESGGVLAGASVRLRGTSIAGQTGSGGLFQINSIGKGDYVLLISYLGFVPAERELKINGAGNEELKITLREQSLGLPQVDITGSSAISYQSEYVSAGSRMDVSAHQLPVSVQVVSRQLLEDQQVTRLNEALRNVSGVTSRTDGFNLYDIFVARGFSLTNSRNYFRNGIRFPKFGLPPVGNMERVEFLKGPASVLYGAVEPGGVVNIVTKPALSVARYGAMIRVGSYGFYQAQTDFTGPVNKSGSLRYRLNAQYEDAGSFRDQVKSNALHIAPVLTYDISSKATITLEGEFYKNRQTFDPGVVAVGDRPADVSRSLFLSEPFAYGKYKDTNFGYTFQHRFNSNWQVRSSLRRHDLHENRLYTELKSLAKDNVTLGRRIADWDSDMKFTFVNAEVAGKIKTGFITQTLLAGAERSWYDNKRFVKGVDYTSTNMLTPVYKQRLDENLVMTASTDLTEDLRIAALYAQDQISFFDRIHLLAGFRMDWLNSDNFNNITSKPTVLKDRAFTPRVGLVVQPIEAISLYGSYSQSFVPESGSTFDGALFKPIESDQLEAGIKTQLFGNRLSASAALYRLSRNNMPTPDPDHTGFQIQIGQQQSKGIEIDIAGEPIRGLRTIASYAYTDARVSEINDTRYPVDTRLANVPYHTASFWATYTIQSAALKGFGFGGGYFYVDKRLGDLANTFALPGYKRFEASLFYQHKAYRIALNGKNLLNEKYYEGANSRFLIRPGTPRTINLALSVIL
ncbi:TonB-dependent receptor [Dyadobacter psychrotolerans]|uniref:TonB-dependent receptor n=1 Tax=Dyadobacter psychrotolerans TaxID=2541721 RepID=A0A4R5DRZ0_9BACT|nr:TonB-dependent receptor [Dyadobacter psychrotolerans]TDE17192.1 TonB-dependent receptor [Dyadobacter psychrotolerans]